MPDAQLDDLRSRIAATRWPDKETVNDESQGIRLANVQELARYWGTGYNWRNTETTLNALPEFVTTIDGVDLVSEYGFEAAVGNNGALTIPANTTGHPAVAVPIGLVDRLPVSMQIIGRRHAEQLLLDLARVVELERPWPPVAPGAPI